MFKNTSAQKLTVLVIDTAANTPKTGDAANLTAYVSKDDGSVTVLGDTSATELDATNAPGLYSFDLTQAETNADKLLFSGKSSTSGIRVVPLLIYTLPANFTSTVLANLDASVNSRMATYTQPTGFLAATFPATVASTTNITAAAGCAVSSLGANVITAASIAADADTEIGAAAAAAILVTPAQKIVTDASGRVDVGAVGGDTAAPGRLVTFASDYAAGNLVATLAGGVVGDITGDLAGNVTGKVQGTGAAVISGTGVRAVDGSGNAIAPASATTAIKAKTDSLPAAPAAVGDIPTAVANADALLGRNIAGGSSTGRLVKEALYSLRNKVTVVAGTLSVYDVLDTTVVWSATVTTDAAAAPVVTMDPG